MKINQQLKILARRVRYVFFLAATMTFASNPILAGISVVTLTEGDAVKLVNKAESIESIDKDNRSHDALFEGRIPAEPLSWVLTADQWEIARNGESILSHVILNDVVRTWLPSVKNLQNNTKPHKNEIIEIQHPGGEEGEVWVQELTDWLVALGIPSRFMSVIPGSIADDEIRFQLYNK